MTEQKISAEQAYRTLITLWAGFFVSQFIFLFIIFFIKPELLNFDPARPPLGGGESPLVIPLAIVAVAVFAASFILKRRFLLLAEKEQMVERSMTAVIVACALAESVSLFGFVLAFVDDYQYFFLWFVLGIIGLVLHIPKRDQLHLAMYRKNEGARTSRPH